MATAGAPSAQPQADGELSLSGDESAATGDSAAAAMPDTLEASEPWAELRVADSPPPPPPPQPLVSQPRGSSQQAAATAPQLLSGLSDPADSATPGGTSIFQLGCMARDAMCGADVFLRGF